MMIFLGVFKWYKKNIGGTSFIFLLSIFFVFVMMPVTVQATHFYSCEERLNPATGETERYNCVSPCDVHSCTCSGPGVATCTGADDGHGQCTESYQLANAACVVDLTCSPSTQSTVENSPVVLTAAGGDGTYAWQASGGMPENGFGSSFSTEYVNDGFWYVFVTSAGLTARCTVDVNDSPTPTVTLTANPTSVTPGGNSTLTWTVANADTCTASGNWSGSKSASGGSEFRSNITSNQTYILTCTNSSGSSSDTATVSTDGSSGTGPNFTYTLTALPNSGEAPLNGVDARHVVRISDSCSTGSPSDADKCTIDYKVDCTNDGTWDGTIPSYNGVINNFNYTRTAADICDYPAGNHTMRGQVTVTQNGTGAFRTQERTVPITVTSTAVPPPTLTYDLQAGLELATASDSFVGDAPVTGLDAIHYMNIQGCGTETSPYEDKCTLEYRVDCTNDGTWEEPQITFEHGWNNGVWKAWNYQVADICDYPSAGSYTMRGEVRVTKNGDPSLFAVGSDTVDVTVNDVLTCNGPSDGTGITGDYFDGENFDTLVTADRLHSTIDDASFWIQGRDYANGSDHFSVRWDGYIEPQCSEDYTLITETDDGVRVWVDTNLDGTFSLGEQVINRWVNQAATTINGTPVSLTKGQKYPLRVEYYQHRWGAVAHLSWSSASTLKEIIPQSQLFPDDTISDVSVTILPDTRTVDIGENASFDTSVTGGEPPYTYVWTALDGTPNSGTNPTFSTSYSWAGPKTLSVRVTDSGGREDIDTATVVVDDPAPLPPPPVYYDLTVIRNGQGTVRSDIAGITCGGDCTERYEDGTAVVLTATVTPGTDWFFVSWENCPSPVGNQCNVTVNGDRTITAKFRNDYKILEI